MMSYEDFLGILKGRVRGKVVILGVGNELRSDDGFGPYVVESLKDRVNATLFNCGTVLENYYNPIVKEKPDVIILLDAVNFNGPFGEIAIFERREILKVGFSTHDISPKVFLEMLQRTIKADIIMIGVKPRFTGFGEGLSAEVKEGADILKDFFIKLLPKVEREKGAYD